MDEQTLKTIQTKLEEERDSVERQLREHGAEVDGGGIEVGFDGGFADSGHRTAETAEVLALVEQLAAHRREVVAALDRIDKGTFGTCERCRNTIPEERLEAIPTATLCVACKQAAGR
ncbi:MAG: TraR/DksA family transcriptional regulator [Actinomycetota bacterium]|nr:TraR/DksA family transcriptional regulator [Actinomycetota bacterium]